MNFKDIFQKNGAQPEPDSDDDAPTGAPIVQGPVRTAGGALATTLHKKRILVSLAVVAAIFGSGGYFLYKETTGHDTQGAVQNVGPASHHPFIRPATPAPVQEPMTPTKPSTPTTAQTQAAAPAPAPASAPSAAAKAEAAREKAEMVEAKSLVQGTGASTTAWQDHHTTPAPAATPPAPAANAAIMEKPKSSVYSTHLVRKEVSPYELLQGTVIPAVLETGIKSDLPGTITAVVNQPVYSSVSGSSVLIPAGSKLIGVYQSKLIAGATRVGVIWSRIEFPNGTYMQIGKSEGYSPKGYAGFHDLVNDHTWSIFKNALLLSLIDVGMSVASPTSTSSNTTGVTGNAALQDGEQSLAQTFGQAESQMFQKDINIAPTLTIRSGYAFNVIVSKDLIFPGPYQHGTHLVNQTPTSAAMPTTTNPYG
ncbi:TrbI/VirB10 family protein [Acidithiobacillus thiooxidans]|uniref:TrbI/VirB10 family protein n=1 Tax=Acidithiobacillus thiooxidans TaxID=930 RepID=UPI000466D2AC|nr:TrbI/VirB10 family protein [Acidithiobacillus thiooxidans]